MFMRSLASPVLFDGVKFSDMTAILGKRTRSRLPPLELRRRNRVFEVFAIVCNAAKPYRRAFQLSVSGAAEWEYVGGGGAAAAVRARGVADGQCRGS